MKLAIIVLCYNDYEIAYKYISTINDFSLVNKIIVVDNHSKEAIYEKLKKSIDNINNNKKIDLIRTDGNLGYARGNNMGIEHAITNYHAEIIGISNTDVEYREDILKQIISFFDATPNAGVVAPVMLDKNGKESLSAWKLPNYSDALWNASFAREKVYNPLKYTNLTKNVEPVDALPGSLFFCKSDVLSDVGYFDSDTFLYGEESLLAYKIKSINKQNFLLRDISFVHNHSMIINQNITSGYVKRKYLLDSNLIYLSKCLKIGKLKRAIYKTIFYFGTFEFSAYLTIKKWSNKIMVNKK